MAERNYLIQPAGSQSAASAPERSAEEIRQDIAARRESITETVDRLSDRFQQTLDWRTYVADYPLAALGVAAGLGFLMAGFFRRRPTPAERLSAAFADTVEDLAGRLQHQLDDSGLRSSSFGLSRTVKAAATGALTKAATDYLRNRLAERNLVSPVADDQRAAAAQRRQSQRTSYQP